MKFRKKPVVVEATQWFKNGDHPLDYNNDQDGFEGFANFANLVAAHEREECAKVCDEAEIRFAGLWDRFEYPCDQGSAEASRQIAAAIRARGEQ